MNISDISQMLANNTQAVAQYLLPQGQKISAEWCVGSISGEKGKSLRIHLTGPKAGVWSDFSIDGCGGDLIDLWREVRNLPNNGDAMREAAAWLGVKLDAPRFEPKAEKVFSKPQLKPKMLGEEALDFFRSRHISDETIKLFKVVQSNDAIVFPFFDGLGSKEVAFCKFRKISAKEMWASKDSKPILFGWQAINDSDRSVVLTEGEIDALTVRQYGFNALSIPFGGGNGAKQAWIEHEFDRLEQFDTVYLALDMDEVGKVAAHEIAERIGPLRCRFVELPHKDPNACLMAGMSKKEFAEVIRKAKSKDPSELKTVDDFREEILSLIEDGEVEKGFKTPWHDKNDELRFRRGEVTVIAGASSHGKSEGVGHMTVHAIHQGEKVCVASLEAKPRNWIRNVLFQTAGTVIPTRQYADACLSWLGQSLMVFDCINTAKVDRMLEVFTYARRRYGVTLFVIDNMTTLNVGIDDYEAQRQLMSKLTDFAKSHDVHVFLVVHIGKGNSKHSGEERPPEKNDIRGSTSISDLADTVVTWWRNRAKERMLLDPETPPEKLEEMKKQGDVVVSCVKQRATGKEPQVKLFWDEKSHRFLPYPDWKKVEYVRFIREVVNCA